MGADAHCRLTSRPGIPPIAQVAFLMYSAHRFILWQWAELEPWWMRNYLADVLCLPVVLSMAVLLQRLLFYRNSDYRLNKMQVIFTVVYVTVIFEGILPHFMPRYTADYFDVAAYSTGGWIYWKWMND
jgi:hypothetical protein